MIELVIKWEKTGLLDGLDEVQKVDLSIILENVAEYMKDANRFSKIGDYALRIMLPMATRIFRDNSSIDIHPERMLSVIEFTVNRDHKRITEVSYFVMDAEIELCESSAKEYIKQNSGDSNAL